MFSSKHEIARELSVRKDDPFKRRELGNGELQLPEWHASVGEHGTIVDRHRQKVAPADQHIARVQGMKVVRNQGHCANDKNTVAIVQLN